MKACVVVPTIREASITKFLSAWEPEFKEHTVIVVEDNPRKTFRLPAWVTHVSWEDIEDDLGPDAWIIPRRSGAIRNYGIMLAGRMKPDMIVMLDDDCLPDENCYHTDGCDALTMHWAALNYTGICDPLFDTMHSLGLASEGMHPRGFPYEVRRTKTVLNHGLWNGVPDLDGQTQLKFQKVDVSFAHQSAQIPVGSYFPMCAMNVAFRPEILPAMYQLPMGKGQPFHRFDDIWCGWIMKKACDVMGYAVRSGSPCIRHVRASDAARNAELEAPGILENERVWRTVMNMTASRDNLNSCLESIHQHLALLGPYWKNVEQAAALWRQHVA